MASLHLPAPFLSLSVPRGSRGRRVGKINIQKFRSLDILRKFRIFDNLIRFLADSGVQIFHVQVDSGV